MDVLALLGEGFAGALTWQNLIWVLVGCVLGTAVGVMPGLGSSMAVALLLPVTFSLDPTAAPRQVHVVDELPRRGIGKLDRAALRKRFG